MKLLKKHLEKDTSGYVTLLPEETEDMWHVYNLVRQNDQLRATTVRRVQTESATGSTGSTRLRLTLTLSVVATEFDAQAGVLRVNGRVIAENKHVKLGSYHTIDLELNRQFTLLKPEWDFVALERVDEACDVTRTADVAAVVLQEGLAHVCLLTPSMTIVRQRIETAVPRKRKGSTSQHEKGLHRFFGQIYEAIMRNVNFDVVKCLIIASPGFIKDQLESYIWTEAVKTDNKILLSSRSKFLLVHSTSGHKTALVDVLSEPSVGARLADTKALAETKALEQFYVTLGNDPDKAYYGYDHVRRAVERGAVGTLMVSDELFRSEDVAVRKKHILLVEEVRAQGGQVRIFSSLHVSGEQLGQLSGVAAILNFPLPDLEEAEEEGEGNERPQPPDSGENSEGTERDMRDLQI